MLCYACHRVPAGVKEIEENLGDDSENLYGYIKDTCLVIAVSCMVLGFAPGHNII